MNRIPKQEYTAQFKDQAAMVKGGKTVAEAARPGAGGADPAQLGQARRQADVFEYIEVFYNRSRRHSTLGSRSPMQFMQDWIAAQNRTIQAA